MRAFNDLHGTFCCSKQRQSAELTFFYSVAGTESSAGQIHRPLHGVVLSLLHFCLFSHRFYFNFASFAVYNAIEFLSIILRMCHVFFFRSFTVAQFDVIQIHLTSATLQPF